MSSEDGGPSSGPTRPKGQYKPKHRRRNSGSLGSSGDLEKLKLDKTSTALAAIVEEGASGAVKDLKKHIPKGTMVAGSFPGPVRYTGRNNSGGRNPGGGS